MPLNTKISFVRTNLAAVGSTKVVLDFAGHQQILAIRSLRTQPRVLILVHTGMLAIG
jgi:hypothetical protein